MKKDEEMIIYLNFFLFVCLETQRLCTPGCFECYGRDAPGNSGNCPPNQSVRFSFFFMVKVRVSVRLSVRAICSGSLLDRGTKKFGDS